MKIAVVGSGAMGGLFGGLLTESGADTWLLDIWGEHVKRMQHHGLVIEHEGRQRAVPVKATLRPQDIGTVDLAIIFVKSPQTEAAAQTAAGLMKADACALTLQNGLGNPEIMAQYIDPRKILAGTTSHGCTVMGPGMIHHGGVGPTTLGMWAGTQTQALRSVADLLNTAGIDTALATDVQALIWNKLLINIGINAITALTRTKNGEILDLENTRALSQAAVQEAMAVARAQGVAIKEDAIEQVFQVARATAPNRSSMGQDVDHQRQTEISMINGAVVRQARELGIPAPVNETLSALVETLQAHYQ